MKSNIFLAYVAIIVSVVIYIGCNQKNSDIGGIPPQTQESQKTVNDRTLDEPRTKDADVTGTMNKQVTNMVDKEPTEQNIYNTQDKRMIIRSGTMSVEVDKYDETEGRVKEIARKYSGYVTNSNSQLNVNGKKQGTITLRVPSEKFEGLLGELRQTGKVMNENISGRDVTEEYMDSEARLKTQKELEERLLKLLTEKTARLTDVVEVEQKLSGVRENIEKTEGRMKYLKDQAFYSTLAVSLYEPSLLTTSTGGGFFYEIEQSFRKGLNGFTAVLTGIITGLIALLPILIIAFLIIYLIVRYLKKKHIAKPLPVKIEQTAVGK